MDFLQRALDALITKLREGRLLRDHGWSILFYAAGAAAALVLFAKFPLDSFSDRAIGQATVDNFSIGGRTSLFPKAILLFCGVALLAGWLLPILERKIGSEATRLLNVTSLAGLALIWLALWKVWVPVAMALLAGAQILIVALAWLDRRRQGEVGDRGLYTAWLCVNAFAVLFPIHDFMVERVPKHDAFVPLFVLAGAFGLDFLRRILRFGKTGEDAARASDRFVHALTPLATLPAITVMRNEVYLLLNQWGILSITPETVELTLLGLVALWCAVRAWRGPKRAGTRIDFEPLLGRFTFPWTLAGFSALGHFFYLIEPASDYLEPANAGLLVQQLFDFGRVPFFETFNAHGLADSFFGFVYTAVVGFKDESWQMFDFLFDVGMMLVAFQVLRRITGSSCAAFFVLVATPFQNSLFPPYCALSAAAYFVVSWAVKQRSVTSWALFFAFLAFGFMWRLDMGFATFVASFATLVAIVLVVPDHRLPIGAMVRGAVVTTVAFLACFLAICAWRGVEPLPLILDLKAIVSSNQAFGGTRMANARTEIVMMHVYFFPVVVTLLCFWMMLRLRGRIDARDRKFSVFLAIAFFSAYYFANYPRGLVRHTFFEAGNTMTSSFAFLVISSTPYWVMHESRRLAAYAGFLAICSTLGFNANLENPERREIPLRPNPIERTVLDLRRYYRVPYSPQEIDRTPVPPGYMTRHLDRILPFLEGELSKDETFLDLSNSPMLYFHAHRISPHYMNHLLLVYGDYLQKRVIEEVADHDVPFVLLRTHSGLASAAGVPDLSSLDDVAFEVRHYRLYEWVYENFEPFAAVQRWQVWIRKDRLLENPPVATDERTVFVWDETGVQFDGQRQASPLAVRIGAGAEPALGPRVMIDPAKTYFLRIAGRSDVETKLTIAWSTRTTDGVSRVERRVAWKPGPAERYLFVPGEHSMRALDELSIEWDAGFEPKRFELVEAHSHECQIVNRRVHGNLVLELGDIPYLWGSCDPDREPGEVLRELDGPELSPTALQVYIDFATDETMQRGIHAHVAAFRQGDDGVNAPARIQVGDRLAFAHSGVRTVVDVKDRDVYLDGAPLDPERDGAPNRVRLAAPLAPEKAEYPGLLPAGQPRYFQFEPLPSRAGGTYLILRARSLDDHEDRLVVDFGRGEEIAGRFVLKLQPDREMREYAVRLTMEYNWFHRDCDWITLLSESSPVEIESARLVQGD